MIIYLLYILQNLKFSTELERENLLYEENYTYNSHEKFWDAFHFWYSVMNSHSPPPSNWFLGEVHAIMEKFHVHTNFKCPIDEQALFYGEGGLVCVATMTKSSYILYQIIYSYIIFLYSSHTLRQNILLSSYSDILYS